MVSAPSGAGKTTLCRHLLQEVRDITFSVSCTTRPPRPGERDGVDYYFVSPEEFQQMIARGEFLEWAQVHGNFYGTPKRQVLESLKQGRDILLDIDVQGAAQVQEVLGQDAVLVFVLPPSLEELERRLRKRNTEDELTIRRRLDQAQGEIAQAPKFDYLVLNDKFKEALQELKSILFAERQRTFRRQDLLAKFS